MGSGATKVTCPRCKSFATSSGKLFVDHIHAEHPPGCLQCGGTQTTTPATPVIHIGIKSPIKTDGLRKLISIDFACPRCNNGGLSTAAELADHLTQCLAAKPTANLHPVHSQCPLCTNAESTSLLADHLQNVHVTPADVRPEFAPVVTSTITCPKCSQSGFASPEAFITHLEDEHKFKCTQDSDAAGARKTQGRSLPKVGDKVVAMWSRAIWQYFTATIVQFMADSMKYEINWDDGDSTGRIVDYNNLAVDKTPNSNELGIGSIILFPQGSYSAGDTQLTGGLRWHQGEITNIYESSDGGKRYSGRHTKGPEHGKSITYPGYSLEFNELKLEDLRVGPNVFDIMGDEVNSNDDLDVEDVDVFFSYTLADSPTAIRNKEVHSVPESYMKRINEICDPLEILQNLRAQGLKVIAETRQTNGDVIKTAKLLKQARVFIACISDQYVKDEQCRMQFQYAKTTLKKPVVPLVVGDSSFEWTFSMVGLLIAGELYIHFKDKSVEEAKHKELLRSLNNYLAAAAAVNAAQPSPQTTSDSDIFISYCWTNSQLASEARQIDKLVGNATSDPRQVKQFLDSCGFSTWLDIERLQSANGDSGLFEQLTKGIIASKVVVPFISDEYASSPNCRMEFQFALKTLKKHVVPVLVGAGSKWKESAVGALICTLDQEPVNLQYVSSNEHYELQLQEIRRRVTEHMNTLKWASAAPTKKGGEEARKGRAPKVGDHVVCHHIQWNYYMATVSSYDPVKMEYTVNWDDGDPSGRIQPFNQVAVDQEPDADDIGVGSIVFFPQGVYIATAGVNTGGIRYHEGVVTKVDRTMSGSVFVSGHHNKGPAEGKIMYHDNPYEFTDLPLSALRMAPTALDAALV